MAIKSLTRYLSKKSTPQSQPIPGREREQVHNDAGGYVFPVTDWTRLDRFLILGSENGTYYASEQRLTRENAAAVQRCIAADGIRTVRRIVEVSDAGCAPRNDPAIFALAMAAKLGDEPARRAALEALPRVCRTGTHLFAFAEAVEAFGGWGRGTRRAVAAWYNRTPTEVAHQVVKYAQRNGWTHRDLLRLTHATPATAEHAALFAYAVKGTRDAVEPRYAYAGMLAAVAELATTTDVKAAAALIADHRLPREVVPTELLTSPLVWEALLREMPLTAMVRNLATMTRVGLIAPGSEASRRVVAMLGDGERLRKARLHPIAVLMALRTYASGRGLRGKGTWQPVQQVVDALDGAFYASFGAVEPSGKRLVLALDVSGSMAIGHVGGVVGLSPREAAAALALVTAATERDYTIVAFADKMVPVGISPRQRLGDAVKAVSGLPFGGTDCALPMLWALEKGVKADAFVVLTDSETWFGQIHPVQALQQYRQRTGIKAKLVVTAMTSTGYSIADPNDGGMLDIVGMDAATPALIADFARGG